MAYFAGKTQVGIAEELGIPLGTVKTRTFAALRKLRRALETEDERVDRPGPARIAPDPEEHERIDELLAGYALRSLTGDDAAEADRAALRSTSRIARDAARPCWRSATPWPTSPWPPSRSTRRRPCSPACIESSSREARVRAVGGWAGVAAGAAVVLIAGGIAISMGLRAGDLQSQNDLFAQALPIRPASQRRQRPTGGRRSHGPAPVSEVAAPDVDHFFLIGNGCAGRPSGQAYGIWLSNGVETLFAGTFVPGPEVTVVEGAVRSIAVRPCPDHVGGRGHRAHPAGRGGVGGGRVGRLPRRTSRASSRTPTTHRLTAIRTRSSARRAIPFPCRPPPRRRIHRV